MRLEDMKNNIPETPEFIHLMIQDEVKKQLQDTKVINIRTGKKKKWTGTKVAAAVAAGALAASTIVYAGTNLYHMFIEKQGKYSISTGIETNDKNGKINLPEQIHDIDISAGYIPEGMEWSDEFHLQYSEHAYSGGFSFSSVLLDDNDIGKAMQDKNVVDYEKRTFGSYEGVYLKYNNLKTEKGTFDQRIYLFCPDKYHRVRAVQYGHFNLAISRNIEDITLVSGREQLSGLGTSRVFKVHIDAGSGSRNTLDDLVAVYHGMSVFHAYMFFNDLVGVGV